MSGSPELVVGDSIVGFFSADGLCQVSGLEFGVFWLRNNAGSEPRLVDYRGRALGAIGGDDIILSDEVVERPKSTGDGRPDTHTTNDQESAEVGLVPAASSSTLLDEMAAFSVAYVDNPKQLTSTVDLSKLPDLGAHRAPTEAKQ